MMQLETSSESYFFLQGHPKMQTVIDILQDQELEWNSFSMT